MVTRKNGMVRRAAQIAQMSASLTGTYLGYQLQRPFLNEERAAAQGRKAKQKSAAKVREHLQTLRGPVMKLGQALSMQTHFLDEEFVEELTALQMQAPPMHPSLMRAQFKSAFGKRPEEVFREFDEEPFAAASLGQVHCAITQQGEEVAVKIQYPAMQEVIRSDFQALRAAGILLRVSGHLKGSVIKEVERGILEEIDYEQEARNIEHFRKSLAPLGFIRVPKVYRELSSSQVLTMSRVSGMPLRELLKTNPSQALRDKLGCALADLFFFQLFRVGALHADPHPGNYLFNEDGTIGLVDFGCVKYLKPEIVKCYGQFWSREWVPGSKVYVQIIRGLFGPKTSPADAGIRRCMNEIRRFYDEFHPLGPNAGPLDLADPRFMDGLGKLAKIIVRNKFLSPEFIFLSRTELGMCNLLHMLRARVPTTQIVRRWMAGE